MSKHDTTADEALAGTNTSGADVLAVLRKALEHVDYDLPDDDYVGFSRAIMGVADLIERAAALVAENEALREACKPLALMAPHYPTVRTFGNRPRTGEIYTVESPNYGVASIKVEDLWRAHDLLSRPAATTGDGNA